MRKIGLTVFIFILLVKSHGQEAKPTTKLEDSLIVTIPAGKQFSAKGWKTLWWGKHYRKEWATPVGFSVLRMDTIKGGLTPLKAGGGHETKTLRLIGGDGREYVLRTIDKSLDVLVPDEFKGTFVNDLVNDQISTAHPYGPLAIAALAEQLSLLHANPVIIYVPDAEELGEFRSTFANKLCLLEERPSGKGWEHTELTRDADDIVNTEKLMEKVFSDTKHRVDQYEFLKVRMFDFLINDWDRHEDQWVWAQHKTDKQSLYTAMGRDRDQAFSKTDGITLYLLSRPWGLRSLQHMSPMVKDVLGSSFTGRFLDRQFLNELEKEDWERAISFIQKELTDSSIVNAVHAMPPEVNKISGDYVIKRLQQRRDNMMKYGIEYYEKLAKQVYINGSEKDEQFIFENLSSDELRVTGLRSSRDTFYNRTFHHNQTCEINVYGLGGNDRFTYAGVTKNRFIIRTIGGGGADEYLSSKKNVDGKSIRIYDSSASNLQSLKGFRVNNSPDSIYQFNRTDYKYDWYAPLIFPGFNPDDGFYLGLGLIYRKQKWGKTPFGWEQKFLLDYAFGTGALGVAYRGLFKQAIGKLDFDIAASYKGPRYILNYYGLGNNTTLDSTEKSFYRVKAKVLDVNPGISFTGRRSFLKAGLVLQRYNVLKDESKFISTPGSGIDSTTYGGKFFGGINGQWQYSSAESIRYPTRGWIFSTGVSYVHNFTETTNNLLNLNASAGFYFTFLNRFTLAHRTGGSTNIGQFEFYQASRLGGNENLRGYWRSRFAGRNSFYQNTDLRIKLANLTGYVVHGQFGLTGFFDDGRVWIKDEESSTLHYGYGGGIYFIPYRAIAFNLYYATSNEVNMIVLRSGFFF